MSQQTGPPTVQTERKSAPSDPWYKILKPCHPKAFKPGETHRRSEFTPKLDFFRPRANGELPWKDLLGHDPTEEDCKRETAKALEDSIKWLLKNKAIEEVTDDA